MDPEMLQGSVAHTLPDACSSCRDARMSRMWKCTADSWPLDRRRLGGIRITFDSICSLWHQPGSSGSTSESLQTCELLVRKAEPDVPLEEPRLGRSDLIFSFAAQTGPFAAWERFVMGIRKMTGTWQNVTRPSDCVRTSSWRFLSFLLISWFVSA